MGCPELDMTSYLRFVKPDENPCERSQSPTKKTAYSRFSRTVTDDPIGNRTSAANYETGVQITRNYTANNLNQYTAINNPTAAPTYDFDGNMLGDGNWNFTWDAENRLVSVESVSSVGKIKLEFAYDYMSRRVFKKTYAWDTDHWSLTSDLRFVYDGYLQIEELNGANSNAILKKNVWSSALAGLGSERLLSVTTLNPNPYTLYPVADANKNITEYLDASGTIKAHYEFSPFGKTVNATGDKSGDFNYRFSSEYLDVETGLVYYIYRYYTPELGRWLSRGFCLRIPPCKGWLITLTRPASRLIGLGMPPGMRRVRSLPWVMLL